MTERQFRKKIENLKIGETVYINAINLSINQIDYLRCAIHYGVLKPDLTELKQKIKPEYINEYYNGISICPQMTYIKENNNLWYK